MNSKILHIKIIHWITDNIPQQRLIILLSMLIGIVTGLAAVLLKNTVHHLTNFFTTTIHDHAALWLFFALPFAGILITVLFVKIFVKEDIVHGITRILFAISKKNSHLKPHNMYSSLIGSSLTVGFGGSVGLESPIVLTGSAIGSNIGQWFRLNYKVTTLLVGCGAAGAIGGIFSAPVAAVVFALEVLMLDLTTMSIIPLLISAVSATAVSYMLMGKGVVFSFTVMDPLILKNMPYYVVLGFFTGFMSIYFTRITKYIEHLMDRTGKIYFRWDKTGKRFVCEELTGKKNLIFQRLMIGSLIVGLLIFICPPLFGEGYVALQMMLSGHSADLLNGSIFDAVKDNQTWLLVFLSLVLLLKVIAMAVTTGSGGVGGIFAPTLFMGGVSGFILANVINKISIFWVSDKNFVLAGMAGMMAGVMHAPLTAIFLITEITGGHALFLPLSLTAAFSFVTSQYVEPHSIYTSRLAKRGELITHDKDKAILTLLKTNKLIEKDFIAVRPYDTLGDLVKCISQSKRNIFPVINEQSKFIGVVLLDNIRDIIFDPEQYEVTPVSQLLTPAPALIEVNDTMETVMSKFEKSGAWNLPVVEGGLYIGFLSKSKIFSSYRTLLQQNYGEN
ncbi:H(+)/Cl(-) exchange transporter ClcA [termite gut metagenome]|uniref:H(+)/Cl(-) exchange transporter ClcA n=1 Tax=termite gut metagenome TaxID=433724 RepID=A0A5J4QWG1_9ZZZZ